MNVKEIKDNTKYKALRSGRIMQSCIIDGKVYMEFIECPEHSKESFNLALCLSGRMKAFPIKELIEREVNRSTRPDFFFKKSLTA
jgi:hypothetical protein